MYIPVTKSCAVRGAGCPGDYKRNNATANMLLDMGDDKLQSAIQKQVGVQCLHFYLSLHISFVQFNWGNLFYIKWFI